MAKYIAVTNQKGGVGKTFIAYHLAAGLASMGWRVALVDSDPQGNTSMCLGLEPRDALFAVMIDKLPVVSQVEVIDPSKYHVDPETMTGALYLLPGYLKTANIASSLGPTDSFAFVHMLDQMSEQLDLDVVIVDQPPTIGPLSTVMNMAVDGYIYVSECEVMSIKGIQTAMAQIMEFSVLREQYMRRDTRIIGIVPNKMMHRTNSHKINIEDMVALFPGLVWPPIHLKIVYQEAAMRGRTMFDLNPYSHETEILWNVVTKAAEAIAAWHPQQI